MEYNRKLVFWAACLGMLTFGIVMTVLGAILPPVVERFGVDKAEAGSLFLLMSLGILAGSVVFGPVVDRYGYRGLLLASAAFAALPATGSADPIRLARDPHIHGGTIAFSYHGDIWLADANGANPRRLTSHVARDANPRFSPDGRWVAFSSNRMGNYDVFVVPVSGGEPEQLTFHSGDDQVEYWTPDGTGIVVATSRSTHPFGSPLYVVPRSGGLPVALPMDFARAGMIKQDGSMIAFNRENFGETRKGYRGNNSADIYVQDVRSKEIRQLTDEESVLRMLRKALELLD